jgi:putative tryptophan/tyrosine transport system substrate-binding protein
VVICGSLSLRRSAYDATRVHIATRRRRGVAARGPRAADQAYLQVGHLESGLPSSSPYLLAAFQQGLRKLGYIEGENLFIERRYAEGLEERLPQLAAELVRFGVDVIFAIGPPQALAAAKATSTIPIVFVGGGDPVAIGLVKSLAHPGGNVTGLTLVTVELAAKRIQLLKEVVPAASRVAILWNPNNSINRLELNEARAAGNTLGLTLVPIEIRTPEDIEGAFGAMARDRADALFILSSPLTFPNRARIAKLASNARLPTLVPLREYVEAGFLTSYGPSYTEHCRQAATYVDQILKGAKPADLPVQLPTRLELVINLKTAKALGLEVPPTLLARADEVIE